MANDFRTRTRHLLGLDPLKGAPNPSIPGKRSAYARFTSPGPDTSRGQLLGGALLYTFLTVFSIALVLGSAGMFGRVLFAVLGVLGFLFAMQRVVILVNGRSEQGAEQGADERTNDAEAPRRPDVSRRTGAAPRGKKSAGRAPLGRSAPPELTSLR